ncbi:hypothetical protein Hanom_Chr12g01141271 [Helianthus anomalus]
MKDPSQTTYLKNYLLYASDNKGKERLLYVSEKGKKVKLTEIVTLNVKNQNKNKINHIKALTGLSRALCDLVSTKSVFDSPYSPISHGRLESCFSHNFLISFKSNFWLLFSTVKKNSVSTV